MLGAAGAGGEAGWIAVFDPDITGWLYNNVAFPALDSSNNVVLAGSGWDGSVYGSWVAKIDTETPSISYVKELGGGATYVGGCSVRGVSDDIYIDGYDNAASPVGMWRTKLNSSTVEQWFGCNSSDQLLYRSSAGGTYGNASARVYLSPDGTKGIQQIYGLASGNYVAMAAPFDTADGEEWDSGSSDPIIDFGTSQGMYVNTCAINNTNQFFIWRGYHTGYGTYMNVIIKSNNKDLTAASAVGMRINMSGDGSMGGDSMFNSVSAPYNLVGNNDRYPFAGQPAYGTYVGKACFQRWNHALGWNTFDMGYQFTVNASDSPATPTQVQPTGMCFDSTDTVCYMSFRDDGNTPSQQYVAKFTPDTSSTTVQWQNKIFIYKTADGYGSLTDSQYFGHPVLLDSNEEFIYLAGAGSHAGANQKEIIIMKLPVDGTGTGTYVVGDYTIVYGTSNMTGNQADIVGSDTGNTFTNVAPYENNTYSRSQITETGTITASDI